MDAKEYFINAYGIYHTSNVVNEKKGYGLLVILINAKPNGTVTGAAHRYGLLVILINAKLLPLIHLISSGYGLLVILINAKLPH